MKILILGAGAVGCYVGAKLALGGHDVVFWNWREQSSKALVENGVTLAENGIKYRIKVTSYSSLPELFQNERNFSLAIISVKSFATISLVESLEAYLQYIEHFLSIQNGIGNEEKLMARIDPALITAASLTTACSMHEPGKVTVENKGGIALAPIKEGDSFLKSLLSDASFHVKHCSDWRSMKWSKLFLNIITNATCAILNMTPEEVLRHPIGFKIEREMLLEAIHVLEAMKIKMTSLPFQPAPLYAWGISHLPSFLLQSIFVKKARKGRGDKLGSLHLDLVKGKKETEWGALYGALLQEARQHNVKIPVLENLERTFNAILSDHLMWEKFKGKPETLLERF